MRSSKLKKLAFDHPYFEYWQHLLPEADAEHILNAGYTGIDEFMQNVIAQCVNQNAISAYSEIRLPQARHHHV